MSLVLAIMCMSLVCAGGCTSWFLRVYVRHLNMTECLRHSSVSTSVAHAAEHVISTWQCTSWTQYNVSTPCVSPRVDLSGDGGSKPAANGVENAAIPAALSGVLVPPGVKPPGAHDHKCGASRLVSVSVGCARPEPDVWVCFCGLSE